MIISCPKCQTQYDIGEQQIPAEGKKFRCVNCGNVWVAFPQIIQTPPPVATAPLEKEEEKEVVAPIEAEVKSPSDLVEEETAPAETVEEKQEEVQEETQETEEKIESEVETTEENTENTDTEVSSEIEENLNSEETNEAESEEQQKEEPSQASSEFNEGQDIPEQFKEVNTKSKYTMEDLDNSENNKSSKIPFIFLCVSILMAIYFGRFYIVSKYPPLQSVYESIGVSFDILGEGLAFQDIKKDKLIVDDINYLVVKGSLINETNKTKDVPNITLSLYDNKGKLIQWTTVKPVVTSLTPGETTEFLVNIEAPSVVATEAKVTFSEAKRKKR